MKKTRFALFQSMIALLLCLSMLVGTTFAWFTDSVSTGINTIAAGTLDVELYHSNAAVADEQVNSATKLFLDLQGNPILWEPGVVSYENLRITNAGDLALAYQLAINTANENYVVDESGTQYGLSQILKVGVVEGGITATDRAGVVASVTDANWTTLANFVRSGSLLPEGAGESEKTWGIVVYWEPGENDNYWNLNNGKTLSEGEVLTIDLGINLIATQEQYESDAFGKDYDATAKTDVFPVFVASGSASATVVPNDQNQVAEDVKMTTGQVSATVPAGVQLAEGTTELTLTVTEMDDSGANLTLGENEAMRSLDVHIEGVSSGNKTAMVIDLGEVMPTGLNMGNYQLYHVENGQTNSMTYVENEANVDTHNEFYYDPATGRVVIALSTFSEITCVVDSLKSWEGGVDYTWYTGKSSPYTIANADQLYAFARIVGGMDGQTQDSFSGKTVKLIADINLGDKENASSHIFYPIGYYYNGDSSAPSSTVNSFEGTFDGQGHTIANFYQNTWEIDGDYDAGYYADAMGLFGYVYGGIVKNLTVDHFSSDGEFTPTGVIAAYAAGDATFENIAITNCNPRVYNTGNGGIIGIAGSTNTDDDSDIILKNITVDNSNKISALWGSWDVACGGLVGMYRGNVDGNGDATGDTISFANCHVAAQIDVNNDVCANYQYYAYRYAGMIIGSVRHNTTDENGNSIPNMTGISAKGCTVNFGDWNDYYYCELVANTLASYTHDHQFSRLEQVDSVDATNKTVTVDGKTTNIPTSGRYNYVVVNGTHGTNNATCYHFVDGAVWNHTDAGTETVDGVEVLKEDKQHIYLEFNQLFTGYGWGVSSKGLTDFEGIENMDIKPGEDESVEKFNVVFPNTDTFLYRVGNQNTVSVSSLFAAKDGATINGAGVYVRIDKVYDNSNVTCTFTPSTTKNDDGTIKWESGTLKFEGTGVVDIVIQDYDYCTPTTLHLEVVDAWNTTTACSAPYTYNGEKYDVVLLNDVENATAVTVSNGYSFYGNGFALNYTGDGSYGSAALSYGFVAVESGGTFDNVKVKCKVFPESYLYTSEMTADSNGRYPYGYSAIVVSGNSTISNCYVFGARNNIAIGPGNVKITNTVTECGSLSNIQINSTSGYTVTLDNVTTIQYQTTSPFDSSAKVLGFGVVVGKPDSASNPAIKLTGNFVQDNWVTEDNTSVSNSYASSAIEAALTVTKYQHTNSNGKVTVNTGIAYLNSLDRDIEDNRTNTSVQYEKSDVQISGHTGYVYSIVNGTGDPDAEVGGGTSSNADVLPSVMFTGTQSDSVKMTTSFDTAAERWVNTLTLDLDNITGGSYSFSFNDLIVQKYGVELTYTVKDSSGNTVDMATTITVNQLYNAEYTLVVADNQNYDKNGALTGEIITRELPFIVYATKTSIDPPQFTGLGNGTAIKTHEKSGTDDNWRPAYKALENVSVTYWSASAGKELPIDLSTLDTEGTIDGSTWSYSCDDYTITITGGQVHTDGSVISPILVGSELYFWSANKAFGTGTTSRNIILTYTFTDKNASTTETLTKTVQFDDLTYYKKSDFANGTLTQEEESSECIVEGTLITMADGTQKPVEDLVVGDMLMVFNHISGQYEAAPLIFNTHADETEAKNYDVLNLQFSNGEELKVVEAHGLFDMTLMQYVYINCDNYRDYIGHEFYALDNDGNAGEKVELTTAFIKTECVRVFCPVTYFHMNSFANGLLNTPSIPGGITGLVNYFEYDTDLKYNEQAMQRDIEKFGLYTYEDFSDYISEAAYNSSPAVHLKVAVGKGMITFEEILDVIEYLLAGSLIE